MHAAQTLLPIVLLIALGFGLARIQFLGREFLNDLNKLAFFVALPAFIVRSLAEVHVPPCNAMRLLLLLALCTVAALLLGFVLARIFGSHPASHGSIAQCAFRGNLAYAGLPVITYALEGSESFARQQAVGRALLVLGPLIALFNFLAVLCLQKPDAWRLKSGWIATGKNIVSNPLILACAAGFALSITGIELPFVVNRALDALGAVALPVALLCIGGSLTHIQIGGRARAIAIAVLVKIVLLPVIAAIACFAFGITGIERLIVLVFAGSPTAAAAYTVAKQMHGDETITSAAIAISTLAAMPGLAIILYFAG
jgi:predicted permease